MTITIEIPKEFVSHYESDRFEDSLRRLSTDAHLMAGNYEKELADMLVEAFKNSTSMKGWIPVSERLPEEERYYLTTTIFKEVYCDYWNGYNFDRTEMVISWMPLPDPWKGEQDA